MDRNTLPENPMIGIDKVALRKESVDRNSGTPAKCPLYVCVALRKESVDRNTSPHSISCMTHVALRKESVDRNLLS